MHEKIEFYRHAINDSDIEAVAEVLHSVFLTTGPRAALFEEMFTGYTGLKHTVSLNSCTAALHLALLALGVGEGDEVIVPAMTFIASVTPIWHVGATPVLVDVEPETGLIDLAQTEKAITARTKAVIPVHLYGSMADMRGLRNICERHGLAIIEDCAHCIEGERDGVRPGHLGDAACYSFYATKNLTCGEGGALATNDERIGNSVRLLRQHGMNNEAADRYTGVYRHWDMVDIGWKYNLSDILATLLVNQLERLDDQLKKRQMLFSLYDLLLKDAEELVIPARPGKSASHLYTVWVPRVRRDSILAGLQEAGIGVAVNYRAVHTLTYFRERMQSNPSDFPSALDIGERTISLPTYISLASKEVEYICSTLKRLLATQERGISQ